MMLLTSATSAQEARPRAVLTYERGPGAEQCPNEPSLRRSVAAHLGYDPFVAEAPLHVVARITSSRRGLRGTVSAREDGELVGEREIPSPTADCVELARALALAISVAVDPFSLTRGQDPDPAPAPPPEPVQPEPAITEPVVTEPVPTPAVETEPETAPEEEHVGLRLGASVGLGFGAVPRVRPFISVYAGYGLRNVSVRIAARLDTPANVDGNVSGSARALAFSSRAYGCMRLRFFEPCAGAGVQLTFAHGSGVDEPRDDTHASPLLGVATFFRLPARGRFGAELALGLDFPLLRPRLHVQLEPVWTMPPVIGTIGIAFDIRP